MNNLTQTLYDLWKYDIEVFSKGWLYYWLLIPAIAYTAFFFLKWTVITAPVWLPVYIITGSFKGREIRILRVSASDKDEKSKEELLAQRQMTNEERKALREFTKRISK